MAGFAGGEFMGSVELEAGQEVIEVARGGLGGSLGGLQCEDCHPEEHGKPVIPAARPMDVHHDDLPSEGSAQPFGAAPFDFRVTALALAAERSAVGVIALVAAVAVPFEFDP